MTDDELIIKRRQLESLLKNANHPYTYHKNDAGDEHLEVEVTRGGRILRLPFKRTDGKA